MKMRNPLAPTPGAVLVTKMHMEQLPLLDDLTMLEVRVGALAAEIAALELLVCGPEIAPSRPSDEAMIIEGALSDPLTRSRVLGAALKLMLPPQSIERARLLLERHLGAPSEAPSHPPQTPQSNVIPFRRRSSVV